MVDVFRLDISPITGPVRYLFYRSVHEALREYGGEVILARGNSEIGMIRLWAIELGTHADQVDLLNRVSYIERKMLLEEYTTIFHT